MIKVVYFKTSGGRHPVKELIDKLHMRTQQKFYCVVDLLAKHGKQLIKPHADHLGDGIYELRFAGIEGRVRIFLFLL